MPKKVKLRKMTPKKGRVTATQKSTASGAKTYKFTKKSGPGTIGIRKKK